MRWYIFELRLEICGVLAWIGLTHRPGWKPWGSVNVGVIRAGWWRFDFGYINKHKHDAIWGNSGA